MKIISHLLWNSFTFSLTYLLAACWQVLFLIISSFYAFCKYPTQVVFFEYINSALLVMIVNDLFLKRESVVLSLQCHFVKNLPLPGVTGILYETLELHSAQGEPLESESDSERRTINVIARDNVYSSVGYKYNVKPGWYNSILNYDI